MEQSRHSSKPPPLQHDPPGTPAPATRPAKQRPPEHNQRQSSTSSSGGPNTVTGPGGASGWEPWSEVVSDVDETRAKAKAAPVATRGGLPWIPDNPTKPPEKHEHVPKEERIPGYSYWDPNEREWRPEAPRGTARVRESGRRAQPGAVEVLRDAKSKADTSMAPPTAPKRQRQESREDTETRADSAKSSGEAPHILCV